MKWVPATVEHLGTLIELLKALGPFAWPVVVFALALVYRKDAQRFLQRVTKAKGLGAEVELGKELDKLEQGAEKAVSLASSNAASKAVSPTVSPSAELTPIAQILELPAVSVAHPVTTAVSQDPIDRTDAAAHSVLETARVSPKVALLELSMAIEREIRRCLMASGWRALASGGLGQLAKALESKGMITKGIESTISVFADVRNRIVHGGLSTDDEILRAIDAGILILRVVGSIPLERHIVVHPTVSLYSDSEGVHAIEECHGVAIRSISVGAGSSRTSVFPTTRTDHKPGLEVSWDWNTNRVISKAYYRDPATKQIRPAWDSATEFIGQHFDR